MDQLQWMMMTEDIDDETAIVEALKQNYEPFAAYGGQIFLKKQVLVDMSEKSSVRPENQPVWDPPVVRVFEEDGA